MLTTTPIGTVYCIMDVCFDLYGHLVKIFGRHGEEAPSRDASSGDGMCRCPGIRSLRLSFGSTAHVPKVNLIPGDASLLSTTHNYHNRPAVVVVHALCRGLMLGSATAHFSMATSDASNLVTTKNRKLI